MERLRQAVNRSSKHFFVINAFFFAKKAGVKNWTEEWIESQYFGMRDPFLEAAIEEAKIGLAEGGIPIGSVLVHQGQIIGRGHNMRVQKDDPLLHGEMSAFQNAGRLPASIYRECTVYTTLSPCPMCSGTILLYKIPKIVIGENITFQGAERWLKSEGVELEVVQDEECIALMRDFIAHRPELWHEDIAV